MHVQQDVADKVDVPEKWWDTAFAPSSCLVLITTLDAKGCVNAAAFGTCTRVNHAPVHIAFTVSGDKDTARNIADNGQFTINVVPFEQAMLDKTVICGLPFNPGINELERAGLTQLAARKVKPPRIAECTGHFECSVMWTKQWSNRVMVCGQVEAVSLNADCLDQNGFVVWENLKPAHYCGGGYGNQFVPVYTDRMSAAWQHDWPESDFPPNRKWRTMFSPFVGAKQFK